MIEELGDGSCGTRSPSGLTSWFDKIMFGPPLFVRRWKCKCLLWATPGALRASPPVMPNVCSHRVDV